MSLINPADTLERQNEKLLTIAQALMRKVEQKNEQSGIAYAQFERAAFLEVQVRERTTDLERTLDLLQESNAQLETARANLGEAIETISEGFALFDTSDRLVLFNSRFCRDLQDVEASLHEGLTFKEYVTLVSASAYLSLPAGSTPENWAAGRYARHHDDHVVFNVSLVRDRWLQISEHRTARGGTVILQTDVTDIIRLERLERDRMRDEQAQTLQATLDHLNQGVCIFDDKQNLVGWNKRMDHLLELPPQQAAMGQHFLSLLRRLEDQLQFTGDFDAAMLERWANQSAGRSAISFEVTRNGEQTFSIFGQEMPDRGFVISFTDVTAERAAVRALAEMNELLERKVADRTQELGIALAEAERANASKSRFVAAASHDLLQPLSAAKLFISTMSDRIVEPELRGVAGKAEAALASVEQIIEALLDISKLDSRSAVFDVQNVRISGILDSLRDELTPVAEDKGIDLRIVGCGLVLRSDPGYLRRIVQNLVTNAIRYTDRGKVLVGVRRRNGIARVEVHDTGRGIAPDDQAAIFQEFKRIDVSQSNAGLGLGLAIVERACKSLNHPLTLVSEPGRGSCFAFEVPMHRGGTVTVPLTQPASGFRAVIPDGLVVFLVENDPKLADAMTLLIEGWGAHVIHAETGEDALALLAEIELTPDALLLDYQLGEGMSGLELHNAICARYGDVPARLISADRGTDLRLSCERRGIELMSKPIDQARLLTFLSRAGDGNVQALTR